MFKLSLEIGTTADAALAARVLQAMADEMADDAPAAAPRTRRTRKAAEPVAEQAKPDPVAEQAKPDPVAAYVAAGGVMPADPAPAAASEPAAAPVTEDPRTSEQLLADARIYAQDKGVLWVREQIQAAGVGKFSEIPRETMLGWLTPAASVDLS